MKEIELKLAVADENLPRVQEALLAMAKDAQTARSTLASTYFDTPDHRLKQDEMVLRVRKQGRRFIQTVKAHDHGDMISRGEWEDVISGGQPDLQAPESGGHVQSTIKPDELRPLFTTVIRRTTITFRARGATRIEAALDKGEIRAADGSAIEAISEVELELKSGDPAVLYDVALRLAEAAPLRVEIRSKAERGYHLIAGSDAKPGVLHAIPLSLQDDMPVDAVLQAIGRRCLAGLLRNEAAALAGIPDGAHQMRVAARRLRAMLSALKPMLPAEHYRWANHELRWLANTLGPARNWDVFARNLLEPVAGALPDQSDLKKLAQAAEQQRSAAYQRAREAILSPRYTTAVLKLARWFESRGWCDQPVSEQSAKLVAPIGTAAGELIGRRYRQAMKRSKDFKEMKSGERHKLRIALKKLRYTIEFLQPLFDPAEPAAFMKRLKRLQDDLGHANDVRAAQELLAELRGSDAHDNTELAGGIVLGWHDRGLSEQEEKMRKHVKRFREAKPFW